jgi:hypothetical protein
MPPRAAGLVTLLGPYRYTAALVGSALLQLVRSGALFRVHGQARFESA